MEESKFRALRIPLQKSFWWKRSHCCQRKKPLCQTVACIRHATAWRGPSSRGRWKNWQGLARSTQHLFGGGSCTELQKVWFLESSSKGTPDKFLGSLASHKASGPQPSASFIWICGLAAFHWVAGTRNRVWKTRTPQARLETQPKWPNVENLSSRPHLLSNNLQLQAYQVPKTGDV